jgi:hypothetical protein
VAAVFENMSDQDRQELAKQVMKAQVSDRKRNTH